MFSYDLLGFFYCFLSVFPSFPILDLVNTYFGYKETTVESAYSFSGLAEKPRNGCPKKKIKFVHLLLFLEKIKRTY